MLNEHPNRDSGPLEKQQGLLSTKPCLQKHLLHTHTHTRAHTHHPIFLESFINVVGV